jgi:hypothetical protein
LRPRTPEATARGKVAICFLTDFEIGVQIACGWWGNGYRAAAAAAAARRMGMDWVGQTNKYYNTRLDVFRLR